MKNDERNKQLHVTPEPQVSKAEREFSEIKTVLDQSSNIIVVDAEGNMTYVNENFCQLSQYEQSELLGKSFRMFGLNHLPEELLKATKNGEAWRGEIQSVAKDGSHFWVNVTVIPLFKGTEEPSQYVSIASNITDRKRFEEQLRESERMHRLITEHTSDLIAMVDEQGNYIFASPSHEKLLHYKQQDLEMSSLLDFVHPEDRGLLLSKLNRGLSSQIEFRLRVANGDYLIMDTTLSATHEKKLFILVMRDITGRKEKEAHIYHLAFHDALTDLPNRRLFMKQLHEEVEKAKRTLARLAVMFIDLDRFKHVNDTWGHDTGDYILTVAANRLKGILRTEDLIGRLGGDEFAIMLKIYDIDDVKAFTSRIRDSFEAPVEVGKGQEYSLSCSVGIALFPDHGLDAETLLLNADTALYAIKGKGMNEHIIFSSEMEGKTLQQVLLENELQKAIEAEQFYLDYQPNFDFVASKVVGMEALLRWHHPDLGVIPPLKFIPLAEETGLILQIGEWVLRKACAQNKEWQRKGYPPLRLSVNLSVKQLADRDIVEKIKDILEETGLDARWLELEVTESVFADIKNVPEVLQEIRELGVRISIDDFGTGYSSFSYIKHLPVDTLKIDASFVRDIHENEESKAIVNAVLTLAQTLGMRVIAEGIERNEQLEVLNEGGCVLGQGFYFSKPLSKDNFERFLQEGGNE